MVIINSAIATTIVIAIPNITIILYLVSFGYLNRSLYIVNLLSLYLFTYIFIYLLLYYRINNSNIKFSIDKYYFILTIS